VSAERPSAVGASKPEPHPEALIRGALSRLMIPDYEASAALDVLVGRLEQVEKERDLWMQANGQAVEAAEQAREALRPFITAGPRYLSIGSIDNTVEVRVSSEQFQQAREALGVPPPGGSSS
jgi:hypothetical protein